MMKRITDLAIVYAVLFGVNKFLLKSLPLEKLKEAPLTVITVFGIIFAGIAVSILLTKGGS